MTTYPFFHELFGIEFLKTGTSKYLGHTNT